MGWTARPWTDVREQEQGELRRDDASRVRDGKEQAAVSRGCGCEELELDLYVVELVIIIGIKHAEVFFGGHLQPLRLWRLLRDLRPALPLLPGRAAAAAAAAGLRARRFKGRR
eukprot:CAMPEP_0184246234 /NCGR_PEP_ID=MMETSP0977-20130417/1876_1 /TAXON_ID=483370 /ORGANISM="non described non described, Strain CCMP2097" /LENGTH=112 /DNA_ID=CAMNT_0026551541 /DNA_START=67 /DNA_END=401 /DNA_ORIENTATION=+